MKEKARVIGHTSLINEQVLSLEKLLNELQYPDHIEKKSWKSRILLKSQASPIRAKGSIIHYARGCLLQDLQS